MIAPLAIGQRRKLLVPVGLGSSVPLSLPVPSTVALFTFLAGWNDSMGPVIYLSNEDMWTVATGLKGLQTQHGWAWELLMAAVVVFTARSTVLHLILQRSFTRGIVPTGLQ